MPQANTGSLPILTETDVQNTERNFFIVDSDDQNRTGRVSLQMMSEVFIRIIAGRLDDSGLLPFVSSGIELADIRRALIDFEGNPLVDSSGDLLVDSD